MASITPRKTKNSTVYDIQICLTKTDRRKLYAFTNKRIAERFGEKIEDLLSSRRTGIPNRDVQEWLLALAQTDPQRYENWSVGASLSRVKRTEPFRPWPPNTSMTRTSKKPLSAPAK